MRALEKSGRTVAEAVASALAELGVERDEVEVEVLEEGNKGILGLLGARHARVRVELKRAQREREVRERGRVFLEGVLARMGVRASVTVRPEPPPGEDAVYLDVKGSNLGRVIGRKGRTLDALQYLVNVVANRDGRERVRIVVDVEGYRGRRAEALGALALRAAARVRREGRRVMLEPMTALERRIVHMTLRDQEGVETRSEGEEPYRRVVVLPRR